MENLSNMSQVLVLSGSVSVIVLILIQLLKKTAPSFEKGGKLVRFLPIISIVLGLIAGAIVYPFTDLNLTLRLWSGFFAGAGASGLYDLTKVTTKKQ